MNKKKHVNILLVLTFFLVSLNVFGQYKSRGKEFNYEDAESFFDGGNYYDALSLYEILMKDNPKVLQYRLKAGLCHLKLAISPEKAIEYIEAVYKAKPKTSDVQYYLGKAYALNYMFDVAIESFNGAIESSKTSSQNKKEIPHLIEQCNYGKELVKDSLSIEIVNIGEPINSINNEYSPTVNADETTIIYTYKGVKSAGDRQDNFNIPAVNGNFYEDIFVSHYDLNTWTTPEPIGDSINSQLHEASISLSPDGQSLYVYKDVNEGDIYETKKKDGQWMDLKGLGINSEFWEGHAAVSPGGKMMFFSSERPDGFGGRDIYKALLRKDGSWGDVQNLGPTINTKYNDDAPFIHSDGVTFSFSSEGHTSIGGYDIFESKILNDSSYMVPRNIGYPINTTSNDIFFYVSGRKNAYYSSAKKGGIGQQDIYVINVNDIISSKPVLLVKGLVTVDGEFAVAKVTVKTQSGRDLGTYYSELGDGKYKFYVDLNDTYNITYEVEGFAPIVESADATKYDEYAEIERDIKFASKNVDINGRLLADKNVESAFLGLRIHVSNLDKSFMVTDTVDADGNFNFSKLPWDDYYLLYLDKDDASKLGISPFIFEGNVTMKGLPFANTKMNGIQLNDDGSFLLKMDHHYYRLLESETSFLSEMSEDDVLLLYGDLTAENLSFKVQIAAYINARNYDGRHLKALGDIEKIVLDDGITRFMVGDLSTLREAKELQAKAIAKGQEDAFVILFLNNERTYLEELIKANIFK